MKEILLTMIFSGIAAAVPLSAAPPVGSEREAELLALVQQLQAEHAQIAGNQAKLEAKAQELAESVRNARFMAARSGGSHVAKPQ